MLLFFLLIFQLPYQNLRITPAKSNHLVHFANKRGSFWVGESNRYTRHFLMGFISNRETVFSDYEWRINNTPLDRPQAIAEYEPHIFRRRYARIQEEVFCPDTLDAVVFSLKKSTSDQAAFRLYLQQTISDEPEKTEIDGAFIVETKLKWSRFVAIASSQETGQATLENGDFSLSLTPGAKDLLIAVATSDNKNDAIRQALLSMSNYQVLQNAKASRLNALVSAVSFQSADPAWAKAFSWALLSFDALNADEKRTGIGPGIYAGFPWFQDYWGRDSFIALRALTVSGQHDLAKSNLLSFLKFQILDDTSNAYGKVPNRVRPDESIYNTADATPRFLIEAARYIAWSGDQSFAKEIHPNIEAALAGTIKYRMDADGLLTHGGADTWMDAVGPKGPYSPRGNRANDIQALWVEALNALAWMIERSGNPASSEQFSPKNIRLMRDRAQSAFNRLFLNPKPDSTGALIADAIGPDGAADFSTRPNQLWAAPLLTENRQFDVLRQTTQTLGTPFGLMSLDPNHLWFHPFHKFEPVYEQDASYHNGIIWVWNTGEWISQLLKFRQYALAASVLTNYRNFLLDGPAPGTLPELFDAIPRKAGVSSLYPDTAAFPGISRFDQMNLANDANIDASKIPSGSGTFSQAWSVSEFLRNAFEDLAGISPQIDGSLALLPNMPPEMKQFSLKTKVRQWTVDVDQQEIKGVRRATVIFSPGMGAHSFPVLFQLPGMPQAVLVVLKEKQVQKLQLKMNGSNIEFAINDKKMSAPVTERNFFSVIRPDSLGFADFSGLDHSKKTYHSQINRQ